MNKQQFRHVSPQKYNSKRKRQSSKYSRFGKLICSVLLIVMACVAEFFGSGVNLIFAIISLLLEVLIEVCSFSNDDVTEEKLNFGQVFCKVAEDVKRNYNHSYRFKFITVLLIMSLLGMVLGKIQFLERSYRFFSEGAKAFKDLSYHEKDVDKEKSEDVITLIEKEVVEVEKQWTIVKRVDTFFGEKYLRTVA